MDSIKKISNVIGHGGLLGLGLVGLYLSYKKIVPEYISYVSCYITCIGLYDLSLYLIDDNYAVADDDKDENSLTPSNRSESLAFGEKPSSARKISREEFDKVVDKILPDLSSTESTNLPIKISLPILDLAGESDFKNPDLVKLIDQVRKGDITIRTSPIKMQVLDFNHKIHDISRIQISEQSDIIDKFRLSLISSAAKMDEPH